MYTYLPARRVVRVEASGLQVQYKAIDSLQNLLYPVRVSSHRLHLSTKYIVKLLNRLNNYAKIIICRPHLLNTRTYGTYICNYYMIGYILQLTLNYVLLIITTRLLLT